MYLCKYILKSILTIYFCQFFYILYYIYKNTSDFGLFLPYGVHDTKQVKNKCSQRLTNKQTCPCFPTIIEYSQWSCSKCRVLMAPIIYSMSMWWELKWKIRTEGGKTTARKRELRTGQQSEKSKFYWKVAEGWDKGVENQTTLLYKERIHKGCSAKCRLK